MKRPLNEGELIRSETGFRTIVPVNSNGAVSREKNFDFVRLSQQIVWVDIINTIKLLR